VRASPPRSGWAAAAGGVAEGDLRALAAQPLTPPPWEQPAALTPTGATAAAIKVHAAAASPPNRLQVTAALARLLMGAP